MVENGHQILLFSQFTSMLSRIRKGLEELGISNYTLQGDTHKEKRAQLVKSFNLSLIHIYRSQSPQDSICRFRSVAGPRMRAARS